jgi:DNA-binding transcriptional ArsR family regulator
MASVGNLAFEALADPTRRAILCFLATNGESSAGEIAEVVNGLCRTSVSSHLRVLRSAGLITHRKQGRFRLYSLDPNPTRDVIEFLARYATSALTPPTDIAEAE